MKQIEINWNNLSDFPKTILLDDDIQIVETTCLTCKHRQRWKCNSKVFQYCGIRKSNRTNNRLLKIKCKTKACNLYEKI